MVPRTTHPGIYQSGSIAVGSDHLFIRYHIYHDSGSPLALPISLYIATVQAHTPFSAVPVHTGRGSKTGIAYTRV